MPDRSTFPLTFAYPSLKGATSWPIRTRISRAIRIHRDHLVHRIVRHPRPRTPPPTHRSAKGLQGLSWLSLHYIPVLAAPPAHTVYGRASVPHMPCRKNAPATTETRESGTTPSGGRPYVSRCCSSRATPVLNRDADASSSRLTSITSSRTVEIRLGSGIAIIYRVYAARATQGRPDKANNSTRGEL